ncbi:MAG: NB-ARC domain-containing protein, partial [Anaerolineae bacterium]|nr:NB-ARC domain-containing protein [Anaerolineae bacterium]
MTDYKAILRQLRDNRNTLLNKKSRLAGDETTGLLNQITDHEQAIGLTEQVILGDLSEADWRMAIKRLLVEIKLPGEADREPVFVNVPAMPAHFVGRDDMMESLIGQLNADEDTLSIDGLGGVGKTTLAVALAHHEAVLNHFKDGVLWASLGPQAGESEVMTTLAAWASALGQD